jgi:DNA-binding NarL/FixJ family response regulator
MNRKSIKSPVRKRVLVVDDHPIVREGLVQRINRDPNLTVCGEAENSGSVLRAVETLKPDLVLLDINLPGRSGLELIKDLRITHPKLPVLALSMHDEDVYAERVLRAGGRGYVNKQTGAQTVVEAIRRVLTGQIYVSEHVNRTILNGLAGRSPDAGTSQIARLTDRELEVLSQIGSGKESRQIAGDLRMSLKTVETHRSNIKRKLKLNTGAQLIRYAVLWADGSQPAARSTQKQKPAAGLRR